MARLSQEIILNMAEKIIYEKGRCMILRVI
ncbi:Undefined function [Listeria monocytogenes N53-1]|nr:Undefined function [Listeria monocytogenes]CCQ25532.1 Undefined function [Listeria monocytogenes N53-1]